MLRRYTPISRLRGRSFEMRERLGFDSTIVAQVGKYSVCIYTCTSERETDIRAHPPCRLNDGTPVGGSLPKAPRPNEDDLRPRQPLLTRCSFVSEVHEVRVWQPFPRRTAFVANPSLSLT